MRTSRTPPLLSEQIVAGALAAIVVSLIEGVRVAGSERAAGLDAWPLVLATLHTMAFHLPAGLVIGTIMAGLVALLRTSPYLAPVRARFASLDLIFSPSPGPTATLVSAILFLVIVSLGAREAYEELAQKTHRADLAGWVMAGIAAGLVALAFLAATLTRAIVVRIAPWFGLLGSIGAMIVALTIAGWIAAAGWMNAHPELIELYGPAFLFPPIAVFSYACAFGAARIGLAGRSVKAARITAAAFALGVVVIWAISGRTYGAQNRVRALVEEETIAGRWLLRRYTRVTDLDGDRFSWGFGGRDCDDFDARVHPGALDEPGDGIDRDCFAGDGAPIVERSGDGAYGRRPPDLPAQPNVIVITIDALRPDHLGVEGYPRPISPNIDAFAARAVRFDEVLAPSSRSIRSIPAMYTGTYPSQIAYGDEYLFPSVLPPNHMLAESLKARGWHTAVTMGTDYFSRVRGFYQGFDDVEEVDTYKPARTLAADVALAQLDRLVQRGGPFFQWIHLFHVHAPYLNPTYPSRYGPAPVDAYDTEVSLVDEQLQRIVNAIAMHQLESSTIVVLASDHGEAFGEHGRAGHANTLYQEELESVLMFRVPGLRARRIPATVSLIDVTPTILNLAGVPVPAEMPARSLVPLMTGERPPDRDRWFFAELVPDGMFPYDIKSIRHGRYKLHWWVQEGRIQLFDLSTDPREGRDLSDQHPELAEELLGTLSAWSARVPRAANRNEAFIARHRLARPPRRMTHPLDLTYPGLFTVLGCDVPTTHVSEGDTIDVTCYFRVEGETDRNLTMVIDIEPPRPERPIPQFHAHHTPLHGRYPTTQWRIGEILMDPSPIRVPERLPRAMTVRLTFAVRDAVTRQVLTYDVGDRAERVALITTIDLASRSDASRDAGTPP